MATLVEDIYNIKNVGYHANPSINAKLRESQIQHWLMVYRETAISQLFMKSSDRIDSLLYQDLGCIELEHIDKAECPCSNIAWGCTIGKAEIPKPVVIGSDQKYSITYIDGTTKLAIEDVGVVEQAMHARWTGKIDRAFITSSRTPNMVNLYVITQNDDLTYLKGRGIWVDPTVVKHKELVNGVCNEVCYDVESDDFPMNGIIRANVYRLIFENEFKLTLSGFDDVLNNNQEDQSLMKVKSILEQLNLHEKRANPGTAATGQGRVAAG